MLVCIFIIITVTSK